jgi:DNA repair protein RadC
MKYAVRTVSWRFHESTESLPELVSKKQILVRSPEDIVQNYRSLFNGQVKERFVVFWLSASNKIIGFEVVTEGLLNSSLSHPREVFRGAIIATAAAVIVAHNHPSGNIEPSSEDIAMTKQLVDAGVIIGIPIHDHIIFTDDHFTSLAQRGLIS